MPSKLYTIWLNPTTYIVVDFQSLEGELLAFVVRLVRVVGDEHLDVARYDTAHGRPHRELVSPRGRLRKKKLAEKRRLQRVADLRNRGFQK